MEKRREPRHELVLCECTRCTIGQPSREIRAQTREEHLLRDKEAVEKAERLGIELPAAHHNAIARNEAAIAADAVSRSERAHQLGGAMDEWHDVDHSDEN